jgi:PAS domain S-box-containing protein
MKKPSDPPDQRNRLREKIIGLGEGSIRKSYYPELRARLSELEAANTRLKTEIEERKRVEQALSESENRFRELAEMLPETVFEMDLTGRLTFANRNAFDQFGYSVQDFEEGLNAISLVAPADQPRAMGNIGRTLTGDDVGLSEYTLVRKDGTTFPGLIRSTTFLCDGQPSGVRGFIIDITRHKQADAALLESEEKHRVLVTQSPDGIFVVDLHGRFLSVNQAICQGLGFEEEELLALNIWDLVPAKYREQHLERLAGVLEGQAQTDLAEYEILDKNGENHFIEVRSSPYRRGGQVIGFQGIAREVTERKKMEAEKKRLEELLRQAQKMEAIGTLAGGVAHDFNNLLQAIQGYTQILVLNLEPDHPGQANLTAINNAVSRAAELIAQLLTFSRKVESRLRPLDLNREVVAVEQMLRRTIPKMIDIRLDLAKDLRIVNADPVQIEQILMNLAVNAKDAMFEGGVITIETRNVTVVRTFHEAQAEVPSGDYALLTVTDTGQGMSAEVLEHIFEPFYTTKRIGRGTGLGLPMVYGIVKSHKGHISCHSETGRGTAFRIYLPVVDRPPAPAKPKNNQPLPRGSQETILVVDDEDAVREVTCKTLEKFGYQVLAAPDGESALELYKQAQARIDLIVLDLGMPGMGGYKCFERLREMNPQAKIIIASGYSFNVVVKEVLAAGAADFIGKPYQVADLLTKVGQALNSVCP